MAQHDFDIANGSGAVVRADINAMADAIATNNSGSVPPSPAFSNQWWFDDSTNLLKQRNAANTAWVTVASKVNNDWVPYRLGDPVEDVKPIIGEVRLWCTSSTPTGWYICDGQVLSRTLHAGLYAVIGELYGDGDGSTTFNLPDFRGRSPIGAGQGDTAEGGGTGQNRLLGETGRGGAETHSLIGTEGPPHDHPVPAGAYSSSGTGYRSGGSLQNNGPQTTGQSGNGTGHNNMHPFEVINFMIYSGV